MYDYNNNRKQWNKNRMTPIEFRRANSSSPDDQIKATDNMNSEFVSDKKD